MNFLIVHEYCGFKGEAEKYIFNMVKILKSANHQVFGMFEYELPDCRPFVNIFDRVVLFSSTDWRSNLVKFKSDGVTTVLIHKTSSNDCLRCMNENFQTIFFAHDHDYHCIRRNKIYPWLQTACHRPLNSLVCGVCSLMIGKKNGAHLHCLIAPAMKKQLLDSTRQCGAAVVPSEYMRKVLENNKYTGEKIFKMLPPCDSLPPLQSYSGGKNILFNGPVNLDMGIDMLILALARVGTDFHLDIAGPGSGEDYYYLKQLIERCHLQDKAKILGEVFDITMLYDRNAMVVIPSRREEPLGMSGIEAFSFGKPVIAFDVGGIGEWLRNGENGLLIPRGDIGKMAAGIELLLTDNDKAAEMGRHGRNMVARDFVPENYLDGLLKITGGLHV